MFYGKYLTEKEAKTIDSFSWKWTRMQMKRYALNGATEKFQRSWYRERYRWTAKQLREFLKNKKFILDAGCGTGWASKWFAELSPKASIFAVDISKSVRAAKNNLKSHKNVSVIQADINFLPFKKGFFDFISCDQVLHHTKNPERTFRKLISHLKPGGFLAFYVYKVKPPLRELNDDFIRARVTKMRASNAIKFAQAMTLLGKSLSDLEGKIRILADIPLLGIKKGTYNIQRFIYWHFLKCFWNQDFGFEISTMVNFDWYHPLYAHRYMPEEIKKWIRKPGLKAYVFNVGESGISVVVQKIKS
jgi:SAM-dependent methyltransferase